MNFYSTMKSLMTNKIFASLKTAKIWNARSTDSFWLLEPSMELTIVYFIINHNCSFMYFYSLFYMNFL